MLHSCTVPVGVASNGVPPLILINVNALNVRLGVNIICAACQSLEEPSSVAPGVDPGCVVKADPPHYPNTVTLHYMQMASNLPPEPAERKEIKLSG